ncbi:MAG: hypothetical protein AB1626_03085 [Candidatus Micrarchaeota archaeon]
MGMYKYIQQTFQKEYSERAPLLRRRLAQWRDQPTVTRAERPTNLARARGLGYEAKKEFLVARVRVKRGKRRRPAPALGRKPGKNRKTENPGRPWQWFAEQKAARRFPNLRAVNSYFVGEDGQNAYYEVILHNPHSSKPRRAKA